MCCECSNSFHSPASPAPAPAPTPRQVYLGVEKTAKPIRGGPQQVVFVRALSHSKDVAVLHMAITGGSDSGSDDETAKMLDGLLGGYVGELSGLNLRTTNVLIPAKQKNPKYERRAKRAKRAASELSEPRVSEASDWRG